MPVRNRGGPRWNKSKSLAWSAAKSRRDSEAFLLRCRLQLAIPRSRDGRKDSSGGVIGEQCPRQEGKEQEIKRRHLLIRQLARSAGRSEPGRSLACSLTRREGELEASGDQHGWRRAGRRSGTI
ncbi:hypothetical protein VTJ04DRAFT_63 [Mycothermus thermophilus]|uniref:uncharacterized protein n=1 Tax=Humicola insolens TaxID=85995 RepID=UPI0037440AA0